MRIESLALKNFRSHASEKFSFDKFTFVVGENATGKSSLAYAIEFLLTGKCPATDAGGRGAESLIRIGAGEFAIEADVEVGSVTTKLFRAKSAKGHTFSVNGKPVDLRLAQDGIEKISGTTMDVLSAVLNSSRFLQMDEKAQKALLTQVLASEKITVPQEILMDAKVVDPAPFATWNGTLDSISQIDSAYKHFYDLRTDTNREIKALGTVAEPEALEDAPDYKTTWKRLDDLRSELTAITARKAREEERYESALKNANDRRQRLSKVKDEAIKRLLVDTEADRLQGIADSREKYDATAGKIGSFKQSIAAAETEARNEIATKRGVVEGKRRNLQEQISSKEEQIAILTRIKSADCPTCQRALSAKDKSTLGMKLNDELVNLQKALKDTDAEMPGLNVPEPESLTKLRKSLAKLETELATFGDIADAESALKAHREAMVDADRCERELKDIKDPSAPDLAELRSQIAELGSRIGKGEEVLNQVQAIERERQAFADWKSKKETLDGRVEILNRLVDFFGPNGIKTRLVGDKLAPFSKAMNNALLAFGYSVDFDIEPYTLRIEKDRIQLSPKQLSESEQFRFGVSFQIALAMATGVRFVLIDRADVLDSESRGELTAMLLESGLDQAVVMSTTDKPAPTELPDGVRFIELGQKRAVAA